MILLPRAWFQPLVRELRSRKPFSTAKKKNYDRRQLDLVLYERISLLSDMIKLPYRPSNCKITTYILIAWSLLSDYLKALKLFFMKLKLKNEIYLLIEMCLFFFCWSNTDISFSTEMRQFLTLVKYAKLIYTLTEVKHFSKMIIVFPWMKSESHSVVSDSLQPYGPYSPWNSPGHGVGSLSLLQGIFPTQESNPRLLNCRQILYQLSYQESPLPMNSGVLFFQRNPELVNLI